MKNPCKISTCGSAECLSRVVTIKGLRPGESLEDRLEKENAELREHNEILGKALGFMVGR